MRAAIPEYLQAHLADAAPGHRFGLYYEGWTEDFSKPKSGAAATLKSTVCPLPGHSRNLLKNLVDRQQQLAKSHPGLFSWPAIASAPFATGLGNEHPLENGFAFLSPYGLPYLPGSGVKGVLRRAAEELADGAWGETAGWTQLAIANLFGPGEDNPTERDNNPRQGALRFWDVYPAPAPNAKNDRPLLGVEIMTPHLGEYYQGSKTPNTSLTPVPIPFLAIVAGSHFGFHVEAHPGRLAPELADRWQTLLTAAFEHAGEWLGFGAKTAVGYGRMQLDPKIAEQRTNEKAECEKKKREDALAAQRAALPAEQRLLAEIDNELAKIPRDPRNGQPIRQAANGTTWSELLNWLESHVHELSATPKTAREMLATEIKKRLATAYKIEGKAEKAMKEKLALIRGNQACP